MKGVCMNGSSCLKGLYSLRLKGVVPENVLLSRERR